MWAYLQKVRLKDVFPRTSLIIITKKPKVYFYRLWTQICDSFLFKRLH